ncbi:hypothetical protein QDR37_03500 [Amnibacterium sp. CER49]|uniref:hypothetical protein n=1 Tax=Amnibacterium sp. CER49 TaxID=3039161 RepID=UPI00244D5F78|nr:hypothetical protein [Amnibacterium sp. CER49]MDH2443005.1 hypothetical protein [Amnibacterium sp. CER49]
MRGTCAGSFSAATRLATTATSPIAVGDFTGDKHANLLDQQVNGEVQLLLGSGSATFGAATSTGTFPASLQFIGVGDFDKQCAAGVVARSTTGALSLYEGAGARARKNATAPIDLGQTLTPSAFPRLLAGGHLSGDLTADLVSIDSAGTMWRYSGNGVRTLSTGTRIGGGWSALTVAQ